MPVSLVLSNGSFLVGLDGYGRIQDLYYDYVGLEDHITTDAVCKIGIWVDGKFSWFSDPGWQFDIKYKPGTLVGDTLAKNKDLGLEIKITDVVHNEKNIFLRRFEILSQKQGSEVRVFLNHQLRMYGAEKKDTVYYDPSDHTIVQYKGRRVAVIGLQDSKGNVFDDFSVGLSKIEGKLGTWYDALDGVLSKNPIEHGTVDSTIGKKAHSGSVLYAWVCMGKSIFEAKSLHKSLGAVGAEKIIDSVSDYWSAWVKKNEVDFCDLGDETAQLYKNSLLVMRTHVDNTGAIIASCDSGMLQYGRDNYCYVWPRDASFTAMALDNAGQHEASRLFFEFCAQTISETGYFFHKYRSDKSLGSSWHGWVSIDGKPRLPIQEDETALVLSSLWKHYQKTKNLEFIESLYNKLIKKAADFLVDFRNPQGLPKPSYDLWEMKWGIHTFTAAAVFDALNSAASFARLLGKEEDQVSYSQAAGKMQKAIIKYLYNRQSNYFYKYIDFESGTILKDETVDASSFYGVFKFGVLEGREDLLEDVYKTFKSQLVCTSDTGGITRYVGDIYYRVWGQAPSNPWLITTLWHAQYIIKRAKTRKELAGAKEILHWVEHCSPSLSVLPEQVNPFSGEPLSATPLIWSHAEYVTTVIEYIEKYKNLK